MGMLLRRYYEESDKSKVTKLKDVEVAEKESPKKRTRKSKKEVE